MPLLLLKYRYSRGDKEALQKTRNQIQALITAALTKTVVPGGWKAAPPRESHSSKKRASLATRNVLVRLTGMSEQGAAAVHFSTGMGV